MNFNFKTKTSLQTCFYLRLFSKKTSCVFKKRVFNFYKHVLKTNLGLKQPPFFPNKNGFDLKPQNVQV